MVIRYFLTNSIGTLVSRILGFLRDLLMASVLGAGVYSDMFFVAFKLPNLFRRIFGEGAFVQAFLPAYVRARYKGMFALDVLIRFFLLLLVFSLLVTLLSKEATSLIAYGFSEELITETAPLVALNFWYLNLIFLVTFLGALLQHKNLFWPTAYGPALLNVALIGALLYSLGKPGEEVVWIVSYGVLIGGGLQLLLLIPSLNRYRIGRLLRVGRDKKAHKKQAASEDWNRFKQKFLPALVGGSAAQFSAFIDTLLASFLVAGSISYLYYANRIFQLPFALFALAVSTALFPSISKALKFGDESKALELLRGNFWLLLFLLSLFSVGGMVMAEEVIWLLFERGEFTRENTLITAEVLRAYLLGLIPFGLAKLLSLWLLANEQQKTAAKATVYSLLVNILFSLLLIAPLGVVGLAIASSIGGVALLWMNAAHFGARRFWDIIAHRNLLYLLVVIVLEVVILGVVKQMMGFPG